MKRHKSESDMDIKRTYASYDGTNAEAIKIAVLDVDEIDLKNDNNAADQNVEISENEHQVDDDLNVDANDVDHYHGRRSIDDHGGENKKRRHDIKSETPSKHNYDIDEIVLKEGNGQLNSKSDFSEKDVVDANVLRNYDDYNDLIQNVSDAADAV